MGRVAPRMVPYQNRLRNRRNIRRPARFRRSSWSTGRRSRVPTKYRRKTFNISRKSTPYGKRKRSAKRRSMGLSAYGSSSVLNRPFPIRHIFSVGATSTILNSGVLHQFRATGRDVYGTATINHWFSNFEYWKVRGISLKLYAGAGPHMGLETNSFYTWNNRDRSYSLGGTKNYC